MKQHTGTDVLAQILIKGFTELKENFNQMNNTLRTIKDKLSDKDLNHQQQQEDNDVQLYPGSKISVNKDRLSNAKAANSQSAFISRILTAVFDVPGLYRRTYSGQQARIKTENTLKKIALDKVLIEEVKSASKFYFKNSNDSSTKISNSFGNKLNYINSLFTEIKSSVGEFNLTKEKLKDHNLNEFDIIGLRELDQYLENVEKFDELDKLIDEDEN